MKITPELIVLYANNFVMLIVFVSAGIRYPDVVWLRNYTI